MSMLVRKNSKSVCIISSTEELTWVFFQNRRKTITSISTNSLVITLLVSEYNVENIKAL